MEAEMIWRIVCAGVGYLFGSFLTAELVARLAAGKAPEQIGTGNPGMANIMANVGKGAGFVVLAGDLAKTFLPADCVFFWPEAGSEQMRPYCTEEWEPSAATISLSGRGGGAERA